MSTDLHSGTESTGVLNSAITLIEQHNLQYRGYKIEDLASHCSFEEVIYLLWYQRLPGKSEVQNLEKSIGEQSSLPMELQNLINQTPRSAHPQAFLRTLVSAIALFDEQADDISAESTIRKAINLIAKVPMIIAAFERYRRGKSPINPKEQFGYAENFLYMLTGQQPNEKEGEALNQCLISYAEHELNASTFSARITAGTMADVYSAVTAALATLKGNLHGGANQKVMEMIMEIDEVAAVEEYLEKKLSKGEKIMGFGHPVYKDGDPRTLYLNKISKQLCKEKGYNNYFEISQKIANYMKEKKNLNTNVDFSTALIFYALGIPTDLYTPVFTMARTSGWIAHILEQYSQNKMIRPRASYTGPKDLAFTLLDER